MPGLFRYQHTSFGLLVQEACKLANTNLPAAWKAFADEVNATLLLHSPASNAQPVSQMRRWEKTNQPFLLKLAKL